MIHEIHIRRKYPLDGFRVLNIDNMLVNHNGIWLTLFVAEGRDRYRSLVRLDHTDITLYDGYLIIDSDDLMGFFMRGYVLGTRYEIMQPKNYNYEQNPQQAI